MKTLYPWFLKACLEAFGFLQTRYGFDKPVLQPIGHDCYVRYQKGDRWVSIGYRIGCKPVVELYHPSCHIKHRRKVWLDLGLRPQEVFVDTSEQEQLRTLRAQAADLEAKEAAFLKGESP